MKQFIKKLCLYLVPFLVVLLVFCIFETSDYWNLKGNSAYMSRALHSARVVQLEHPSRIVLGDSRMANVNEGYLEELTGEDWCIMAYGGATLNESIQQFWYAAERTELKEVVMGITFYTINDNHLASGRLEAALEDAEHPMQYLSNFQYWAGAWDAMKTAIRNGLYELTGNSRYYVAVDNPSSLTQEMELPTEYNAEGYRTDLYNYSDTIYNQCATYKGSVEYLARLQEIIDYCDENGIELTFVMPACNRVIWDRVIYPLDIDFYMDIYKDYLKSRATVYDMEFYSAYAENDDYFQDGFHFVLDEKLRMTRIFFGGEESEYCLKTTAEEYLALKESGELDTVLAQYNTAARVQTEDASNPA